MHICQSVCLYMSKRVRVYTYIYIYICIYLSVCLSLSVKMYILSLYLSLPIQPPPHVPVLSLTVHYSLYSWSTCRDQNDLISRYIFHIPRNQSQHLREPLVKWSATKQTLMFAQTESTSGWNLILSSFFQPCRCQNSRVHAGGVKWFIFLS